MIEAINSTAVFLVTCAAAFAALVLVCDTFSRFVESRMAAWRHGKACFRSGWQAKVALESERLGLEVEG